MRTFKAESVEEYFSHFPEDTQKAMAEVKAAIYRVEPQAEEGISYDMPTYKYNGLLAHFAAYEKHIGLYPGSEAVEVFKDDIKQYKHAKGSIQFPLNQPMPVELIERIVRFRQQKNERNKKT